MHPNENRKMRTPDAASYAGVSTSTFNKWRITGEGPRYSKLGKIVVYDRADLDTWLASKRRTSTSDTGKAA